MNEILIDFLLIPAVLLSYILDWYETFINGREPKTGQNLYKHKTKNTVNYYKRCGLKHLLNRWKITPTPKINSYDINNIYPHVMSLDITTNK